MFKALIITTTVLLAVVAIRRWGILNTLKEAVFNKVDDLIGMVSTEPVSEESKSNKNVYSKGTTVGTSPSPYVD